MATCEKGKIDAVLMDELGVPLAVIIATDSSMKLERHFPPVTEKCGNLFGFAITSYFRSRQISPPQQCVIKDPGFKNASATHFFSDGQSDSSIIYLQKNVFSLLSGDKSFSLIDENKEPVCHCVNED